MEILQLIYTITKKLRQTKTKASINALKSRMEETGKNELDKYKVPTLKREKKIT
jgi:hypothetical protein